LTGKGNYRGEKAQPERRGSRGQNKQNRAEKSILGTCEDDRARRNRTVKKCKEGGRKQTAKEETKCQKGTNIHEKETFGRSTDGGRRKERKRDENKL